MKNYTITYTANNKAIGDKVLTLNKFDQVQLQNKFDEYAAKMQPGDILEYTKDDLSSKKVGGLLLYVENEKGVNYIYNLNNNRKKKYKVQPTAQPKSEAYGKSKKQPIQVDYAQEIAQRTGTRKEAVQKFLDDNKIDPLTLLQGIGSKRIQLGDFLDAFTDKRMVGDFLKKYNLDGDGSSVWKATQKESLSEMIRRVIKEEQRK